jgi:preprotein translocase subunit SecY
MPHISTLSPLQAFLRHLARVMKKPAVSPKTPETWAWMPRKLHRTPPLPTRLLVSALTLLVPLAMAHVPLLGFPPAEVADRSPVLRALTASSDGSWMHLGVTPIMFGGILLQVAQTVCPAVVNAWPAQQAEVVAVAGCGVAWSVSVAAETTGLWLVVWIQLMVATTVLLLLDLWTAAGWGVAESSTCYVTLRTCIQVAAYLGQFLLQAVYAALDAAPHRVWRPGGQVVATAGACLVAIVLQEAAVSVPLVGKQSRARVGHAVGLLHATNTPLIMHSVLVDTLQSFSRHLSHAGWVDAATSAGLLGLLEPPTDDTTVPWWLHWALYMTLSVVLTVVFSRVWVRAAGLSSRHVSDEIASNKLNVPGFRDTHGYMRRYVRPATDLSGATLVLFGLVTRVVGTIIPGESIVVTTKQLCQFSRMLITATS